MTAEYPPCADRCTLVADIIASKAVDHGRSEREERIAWNLTPEFVPPLPRVRTSAAARWLERESTDD